ncbi:MAG TPA: thermosome subunit, partial [Candidatus Altiarchaeales archaeon]|nr:thermosome subunit [Candidatus Altiarchaeales archaeon]HEX55512.1 thermosome subunit [Candidatus Altiarchaeales archaeon]
SGGGATEIEVARRLKEYSESVGGREQLAINAFADAIEIIPRTLAESTGLDAIDMLVRLRAEHDKGKVNSGILVLDGKIGDMWENGVIEPLKIKTQAVKSASEAAIMILRIDDVISASKTKEEKTPPMPEEGGGYGGGM